MNKIKLCIFLFAFIIIFCFIGVLFVQADIEIKEEEDVLKYQNNVNKTISVYGYTFDNPNVIVDPYNSNYNSALIMFETDDYASIRVSVNDMYNYVSNEEKKHYIGVYNLVVGVNYINLSYENYNTTIKINILEKNKKLNLGKGILLSNNHLLIPTDEYIEDGIFTGIREVDALGKIYYEYLLENGYKNIACEIDDEKLAVLSNELIILDRQNGNVISSFDISDYKYDWMGMEYIDGNIIIYSSNKNISINEEGDISEYIGYYNMKYLLGDINYDNNDGVRFYKEIETKKSDENIWLLNYSNKMNKDIDIKKEFNRIVISSNDINDCNNYLILDRLLDKRIYELCDNVNYIYSYDFKGKYSIYFKINDEVYKTDKYLNFDNK